MVPREARAVIDKKTLEIVENASGVAGWSISGWKLRDIEHPSDMSDELFRSVGDSWEIIGHKMRESTDPAR